MWLKEEKLLKKHDLPTELKNIAVAQNHQFVIENIIGVLHNQKAISVNVLERMKVMEIIERIYANSL
jgi:hypothetical protein